MKHLSMVIGLLLIGVTSTGTVMADATQGSGPGNQQKFADVKQRIEQRIQDQITKMQGRLSCVQNAQDPQTLRSCLPKRRGRGGNGMRQEGGNN